MGGVVLLIAGSALAGQRSRGGDSMRGDVNNDAEQPVMQWIAPGVGQAVVNGVTLTANADGSVFLEEGVHPGRAAAQQALALVLSSYNQATDQTSYANGVVVLDDASMKTPEELLAERLDPRSPKFVQNMTQNVGGENQTVFADGAVLVEMGAGSSTANRSFCSKQNPDICADGAILFE